MVVPSLEFPFYFQCSRGVCVCEYPRLSRVQLFAVAAKSTDFAPQTNPTCCPIHWGLPAQVRILPAAPCHDLANTGGIPPRTYCLPNPRVKKLCMVSVWILVILRVGNERFVQNLITEVKVQETSLKMKAKKDSSGKLREQSALLIWASGSIWLVLYLAAAPSPSSKCSRWPRELPLGN